MGVATSPSRAFRIRLSAGHAWEEGEIRLDPDERVRDVVQLFFACFERLGSAAPDAVALWAIAARISAFGFTPNRVAALGEKVILLVNLPHLASTGTGSSSP